MNIRHSVLAVALCFALSASSTFAAPQASAGAPLAEPSKSLYWQGHEALGRSDWRAALEHFRELERELGASKTEPSDAAIYWQAYALKQANRPREAAAEVERLRRTYPKSSWLDDAEALAAGVEAVRAERDGPRAERDERDADALMALDALLAGGNKKAVPMLQRVLAGTHSDRVKGRAIFVLSQIDPAAAESALVAVLEGNASSRLKSEAIRMIAAGGRRASLDRLLPVYRDSSDAAVKRGVLDAFLIGDRSDLLLQLLEVETDPRRRRDVIEKLGAMDKGDELRKLYTTLREPADRRAVLRGLGIAGAEQALLEVARSESDAELKAEAIQAVAITGGKGVPAQLLTFYGPEQPKVVREAVIQGLMIADATEQMVELYRKETDPKLKRDLLQRISASDSDAVLDLIDDVLER